MRLVKARAALGAVDAGPEDVALARELLDELSHELVQAILELEPELLDEGDRDVVYDLVGRAMFAGRERP